MPNSRFEDEERLSSENQIGLQVSVGAGGLVIAIIVFILALDYPDIRGLPSQAILSLLGVTTVAFFTAATFYLKGSNPYGDELPPNVEQDENLARMKALNIQGDVFYAIGLLSLFFVTPLLYFFQGVFLASSITTFFIIISWIALFSEGVGLFAWKIIVFSIVSVFKRKVQKKEKDSESRSEKHLKYLHWCNISKVARHDWKFDLLLKLFLHVILIVFMARSIAFAMGIF